jgi:hypothetical protein
LHGWVAGSHFVVHTCDVESHELPGGQSATEPQPQKVAPPLFTHCVPFALAAQSAQAGAEDGTAQAVDVLPCTHDPALQQPPLHVSPPAHDAEHARVAGLQACPTGHSALLAQPAPASPPPPSPPSSPPPASTASCAASGTPIVPSTEASTPPSIDASSATLSRPPMSSPHDTAAAVGMAEHTRSARKRLWMPRSKAVISTLRHRVSGG